MPSQTPHRWLMLTVRGLLVALTLHSLGAMSFAVPILQLYVEGGVYNEASESWTVIGESSQPIRLWTIGNVSGPGGKGAIVDVRIAVSYDSDAGVSVVNLDPSTTGGYNGIADPSVSSDPIYLQTVSDGSRPLLFDGTALPPHGVYGPDRTWQEFLLGDFTLTDSPIGDFIDSFPAELFPNAGQINVYSVTAEGFDDTAELHFDLYDHVQSGSKVRAVFAPFSHDADATVDNTPEPASLIAWILGGGSLGLVNLYRKRKGRHNEIPPTS